MNTHATALVLIVTLVVVMEIWGFLMIRFGRQFSPPLSSELGRHMRFVGRLMCYLAPILLIVGLIGLAMARFP